MSLLTQAWIYPLGRQGTCRRAAQEEAIQDHKLVRGVRPHEALPSAPFGLHLLVEKPVGGVEALAHRARADEAAEFTQCDPLVCRLVHALPHQLHQLVRLDVRLSEFSVEKETDG